MSDMIRIVMTPLVGNPTREELNTIDRCIGETMLAGLPAEWAGWIIEEGTLKLSCQWFLPTEYTEEVRELIEHDELDSHFFSIYEIDDEENEEFKVM